MEALVQGVLHRSRGLLAISPRVSENPLRYQANKVCLTSGSALFFQVLVLQCVSRCWVTIIKQALPQLLVSNTFAAVLGASDNQLCTLTQLNICFPAHMLKMNCDKIMADTVILTCSMLPPLPDHIRLLHRSYMVAKQGSTLLACMSPCPSSTMQVICSA